MHGEPGELVLALRPHDRLHPRMRQHEMEGMQRHCHVPDHQVGKLGDARSAPGRPKVDEAGFAGVVFAQRLQTVRAHRLEVDRFSRQPRQVLFDPFLLTRPFDRATESLGLCDVHLVSRQQRVDRIAQIVGLHPLRPFTVVNAADVAHARLASVQR